MDIVKLEPSKVKKISSGLKDEAEKLTFVSPSTSNELNSIVKVSPSINVWFGIGVTTGASLIGVILILKVPTSSNGGSGNSKSEL